MKTYDVVVLGGGTAGSAAAKAAHEAGARTVLFNDGEFGGLCILRGCMPTKTMLHSASIVHLARHHGAYGIGTADLEFEFPAIMENKNAKVARFQRAKIASIERGGYDVVRSRARFTGPDTVEAGGEVYRFTRGAVIATGSETLLPNLPGLAETPYLTSDDLMTLVSAPESLIILGAGATGLEFAQFFARLGTEVELVSRRPTMCDVDLDIAAEMERVLDDEPNLRLHQPVTARAVHEVDGGVALECERDAQTFTLSASRLVIATGRRPAVQDLGLELASVRVGRTTIEHGPDMRTSNPRIFVAGDVTGDRQLLHVANQEGRIAGLGAAGAPGPHVVDERLDVSVVFFDPVVARVGFDERGARAAGHDVITALVRFAETGRAITMDVRHGVFKLVAERSTGEILGAQILGPRADDIVHVVAAIMFYRGTARDMLEMPWYHPTLTEVLLDLARGIVAQVGR